MKNRKMNEMEKKISCLKVELDTTSKKLAKTMELSEITDELKNVVSGLMQIVKEKQQI